MMNHQIGPTAGNKTIYNYGYIMVLACFTMMILNVGLFVSAGVFFKPILNDFGWSRAVTSGPISIGALVTGMFSILTGALTDRFGPRLVITICVIIAGAGYLLMSQLNNIWQLYFYLGLLTGIGSSSMVPMMSSVSTWFTHRRTVMMGIISAGGGLGGLIVPLIAAWLIGTYQWRTAYLILGAFYLGVNLIAAQFLRRRPRPETFTQVPPVAAINLKKPSAPVLKAILLSKLFWINNLVFFCFGVCALTVQFHIVNHATDINISPTAAAGLLSVINGASIVGSVVLGMLGDKFGNKTLFISGFVAIGIGMISLLFFDTLWQLNIFAVVFGLAFGAGTANSPALVSKIFGVAALGLILGISNLSQTIGGSLGGFLAGYIFDVQNSYQTIFIICAALCLLGMTATYFLKSSNHSQ
jgi:MFS family permease